MRLRITDAYLAVLSLLSLTNAAVVRHCLGLEGSSGNFIPSVNVHSQFASTALVAHIGNFKSHLIRDMELDVTVSVPRELYPLTQDDGLYNYFNETAIFFKSDGEFEIINTELEAGETLVYNGTFLGVYCVLVHQDGESVDGLVITSSHSYGDSPLTTLLWVKLVALGAIVCLLHQTLNPFVLPLFTASDNRGTMGHLLKYAMMAKAWKAFHALIFVMLNALFTEGNNVPDIHSENPLFAPHNIWYILHHLLSLVVVTSFHKLILTVLPGRLLNYRAMGACLCLSLYKCVCVNRGSSQTLTSYSLENDSELAVYAALFSSWGDCKKLVKTEWVYSFKTLYNSDGKKVRRLDGVGRELVDTDAFVWLYCQCMAVLWMFLYFLSVQIDRTHTDHPSIETRLDPRTSFTYVILWNYVCNRLFGALPQVVVKHVSLLWSSASATIYGWFVTS